MELRQWRHAAGQEESIFFAIVCDQAQVSDEEVAVSRNVREIPSPRASTDSCTSTVEWN